LENHVGPPGHPGKPIKWLLYGDVSIIITVKIFIVFQL